MHPNCRSLSFFSSLFPVGSVSSGCNVPETGEINWDCPCLGGMAHGPCGEEFKAAFSCFVYSKEEPKGMDCIDKFQHMQDCFRLHPEVYGDELADDEEAAPAAEGVSARDASAEGAPATESSIPNQEIAKTDGRAGEPKPDGEKAVQTSSSPTTRTSDATKAK
ncbi:hypothetical protein O1611_g3419 [Lasiodiplodia mahajangana]|uniref:Uncharacterized protein n=1 Tax=Lasiodiplodia mahajangana TaxID=1108764 RepID=A0ACC2JS04_9PEZI|nr:hypothetical protein O1611_g3419 [Lasiodiplodia mahajangana]